MSDRLFNPSVFGNRSQIWRICLGLFLIVIIYVSSSFGWFIALDRLAQIRLEGLGSTPADLAALLFSFFLHLAGHRAGVPLAASPPSACALWAHL